MSAPELLSEKVLQLLANPDVRLRLGKAARQRALLYDQRLTLNHLLELVQA